MFARNMFDEMTRSEFAECRSPNRMLEVTIHKVCYPIPASVLHQIFGRFGKVEEVSVCMGVEHVEAQVIFQSKLEAAEAFGALHGRHIYDGCCQMEIKWGCGNISQCLAAQAAADLLPSAAPEITSPLATTMSSPTTSPATSSPATISSLPTTSSPTPAARVADEDETTILNAPPQPHRIAMSLDTELILQALSKRFEALDAKLETWFSSSGAAHQSQEASSEHPPSATAVVVSPSPAAASSTFSDTIIVNTVSEHAAALHISTEDTTVGYTPARCSTQVPTPTPAPANIAAALGSPSTPPTPTKDTLTPVPVNIAAAAAAALGAEEETPTKPHSKCSTECLSHDITVPKPFSVVPTFISAPAVDSSLGTDKKSSNAPDDPLAIYDCSMQVPRYITSMAPSLSNGIVLLCECIGGHECEKVLEGINIQSTVMFDPLLAHVFDVVQQRPPWPPPIQLDMPRINIQLRPIPWPSFASQIMVVQWNKLLPMMFCDSVTKCIRRSPNCEFDWECWRQCLEFFGTALQAVDMFQRPSDDGAFSLLHFQIQSNFIWMGILEVFWMLFSDYHEPLHWKLSWVSLRCFYMSSCYFVSSTNIWYNEMVILIWWRKIKLKLYGLLYNNFQINHSFPPTSCSLNVAATIDPSKCAILCLPECCDYKADSVYSHWMILVLVCFNGNILYGYNGTFLGSYLYIRVGLWRASSIIPCNGRIILLIPDATDCEKVGLHWALGLLGGSDLKPISHIVRHGWSGTQSVTIWVSDLHFASYASNNLKQAEVIYKQMTDPGVLILKFYDLIIEDP